MEQLRALGISARAESIYLDLITRDAPDLTDLVLQHGADLDAALGELAAVGLVERSGDKVSPRPPGPAMEAVAHCRTRQAEAARESASVLSDLWTAGIGRQTIVELLPS